jgi:sirohydrochlorin cobaltochelatase
MERTPNLQDPALVLLGHGVRGRSAPSLGAVAAQVALRTGLTCADAYLSAETPALCERVAQLATAGVRKVVVVPMFLSVGTHLTTDVPFELERARGAHPGVEILAAPHLGEGEGLAALTAAQALDFIGSPVL